MDDRLLAHGLGGANDLPIPVELAVAGAVGALVVSFAVLAIAWRSPRYDAATSGRPAPAWLGRLVTSTGWRVWWRAFGVVALLYVGWAAIAGQNTLINPFLGVFYVLIWVGLVPLSVAFGPVWKAISPHRTINLAVAKLSGRHPSVGLYPYPARLGYWPAVVGLSAFVWFELVYPSSNDVGAVRLWCAAYLAIMLIGGALFGDTFFAHADPFEVYSTLAGKLSVWGTRDGQVLIRSPLANLDTVAIRPGLVGVVAVLFGSTAFDSFAESAPWVQFVQSSPAGSPLLSTLALVAFCVAVAAIFALATGVGRWTEPAARHEGVRRSELPDVFAHSVVPIIVGYIVAHYLTLLVEHGQKTIIQLSDPLSRGDNLLGTADLAVNYWLSNHPSSLATLKVVAVVTGHVLGVIAAHDRAVRLLPADRQLTGQLPLLVAMVFFTAGGLYLLFAA